MTPNISRRDFVMTSTGTLAAASIPLLARAAALPQETRRATRPLEKAVNLGMVAGELSLTEKFRLLADLGFDGVELDSPNPHESGAVEHARDETGLTIHGVVDSVHWQSPLSDPDPAVRARGLAGLETALRDCNRYGGSTVLLVPAIVSKTVSYDDAYRRSQDEIRKVLPLAAKLEVTIAIENVWNQFLLSPLEAARYVDELESPWIGWYLDVGNLVNYGWPEQWVRILGPRIRKIHVKEFSRARRNDEGLWKGFDVELLEGDCDWPAVMKALDEIKYDGWMTAEVRGGDAERLREIAARMDRILAS